MTASAQPVVSVEDRAGSGHRAAAQVAMQGALLAFRDAGHAPRRPVRVVLEALAVPAFCETRVDGHVLHLQAAAVAAGEPWLDGLLAREAAHMALSDTGHASHDPALLQVSFEAARERSGDVGFLGVVATLNHHVRDAYADALAHEVAPAAAEAWLRHLAASWAPGGRGAGDAAVELGYAAGTMRRLGLALPPGLGDRLQAQEGAAGLAEAFAALPAAPSGEDLEAAVRAMVGRVPLPDGA